MPKLAVLAHIGVYIIQVNLVDFRSRGSMDIMIAEESVNHVLILAEMCHNTQFNLRVVRREEKAAFIGNECFADFFPVLIADGDILQVRTARTEASRSGDRLVERSMHPSCARVDK